MNIDFTTFVNTYIPIRGILNKWLFKATVIAVCLLTNTQYSHAQMYKWIDEYGQVHYSETPPDDRPLLKIEGQISSYSAPKISNLPEDFFTKREKKSRREKVVMYSAQWCGVCKKAKKYFTQNKIPFTEHDIDKSKKAKRDFDRLNGRGVPIILVGHKRMNGFSAAEFKKLYGE